MKTLVIFLSAILFSTFLVAQTAEDLLSTKAKKQKELADLEPQLKELSGKIESLKNEIVALNEKTTPYPRWEFGSFGNVGLNISIFNNWLSKSSPNTTAINIGITTNEFANLDQPNYFWRNNANLTLGWLKFDDRNDPTDSKKFKVASDAFNASSLFGYKLSDKFALSALGEYRTSVLENKFNNPGYLDLGVGGTWTPVKNLVVVIHPLDYNFVFSNDVFNYESSLGAKVVVDYTKQITKHINWSSNVSGFLSYKSNDLSNWTWVNHFTTAMHGFGIGLDIGLRGNKQESLAADRTDNPLQSYWILGLAYKL